MKNPGVTAVEARKTLCLMSGWRLCIVIQRSMFQHYSTTAHTKTSITVILSGFLLSWDLHWIFTSVIINSAAADKHRQEPSLDQRVIETLITWNVLSMVLSDNNWAAPKIILTHYIALMDPGVAVDCGVEGWWGRNVGIYIVILCCCDWCISNCDVPQLTGLSSAGHDSILTLY